jgi:hypothetical protein
MPLLPQKGVVGKQIMEVAAEVGVGKFPSALNGSEPIFARILFLRAGSTGVGDDEGVDLRNEQSL